MTPVESPGARHDREVARSLGRAPVRAGAVIEIGAPVESIWEVLVLASDWDSWYSGVKDTHAEGPLEHGSRFHFKAGPAHVHAVVEEIVVHRKLRFAGGSAGSSATYMFRLAPSRNLTVVEAAQTMGGVATLAMKPLLQGVADKAVVRWLDALRARVEED